MIGGGEELWIWFTRRDEQRGGQRNGKMISGREGSQRGVQLTIHEHVCELINGVDHDKTCNGEGELARGRRMS